LEASLQWIESFKSTRPQCFDHWSCIKSILKQGWNCRDFLWIVWSPCTFLWDLSCFESLRLRKVYRSCYWHRRWCDSNSPSLWRLLCKKCCQKNRSCWLRHYRLSCSTDLKTRLCRSSYKCRVLNCLNNQGETWKGVSNSSLRKLFFYQRPKSRGKQSAVLFTWRKSY